MTALECNAVALAAYRKQCTLVAVVWTRYLGSPALTPERERWRKAYEEEATRRDAMAYTILSNALEDYDHARADESTTILPAITTGE